MKNVATVLKTIAVMVLCVGLGVAAGIAVAAVDDGTAGSITGTRADDSVITAKIKSELVADRSVNAFDIRVETKQGEVLLSGFVDSHDEIDRAVRIASRVKGVRRVDNQMRVKR